MNTPVSFETSKLLKEKGFEQKTKSYTKDGKLVTVSLTIRRFNPEKIYYPAPTIAEVVMWLYEKYSLWILALPTITGDFAYKIVDVQLDPEKPIERPPYKDVSANDYNSPTEAYEAAILYCLKENFLER